MQEAKAEEIPSDAQALAKKVKAEDKKEQEYFLEIKWYRYEDSDDGSWKETPYSMFADDIMKFEESRIFSEKEGAEMGENHEYTLEFCLVDSKAEDRMTLVEISTWYWTVPINLMHFHQLSGDLASFCRMLWKASGRRMNDYSDMAIEFGSSPYSSVEVIELVEEATDILGEEYRQHVMYFQSAKLKNGATMEHSSKLISMLFRNFDAVVISFKTDLFNLGITSDYHDFGFNRVGYDNVFVGPNENVEM